MPWDLDCADRDFRTQLSDDQLERLERRQTPAPGAAQPPTALAAAVDRLSSGAGDDATTPPSVATRPRAIAPTVVNPPRAADGERLTEKG